MQMLDPPPQIIDLIYSYQSRSVLHPSFEPAHSRPFSSNRRGVSSLRTFSTRAPSSDSFRLHRRILHHKQGVNPSMIPANPTIHFETNESYIVDRLSARLTYHLRQANADPLFYHQWKVSSLVAERDVRHLQGFDERASTATSFVWDAARVNDFLHEPTNFKSGTGPGGVDVIDSLRNTHVRLAPPAGSGTADQAVAHWEGGRTVVILEIKGVIEDKPHLSRTRQEDWSRRGDTVQGSAGKGYSIELGINANGVEEFIPRGVELVQCETHVHVQVRARSLRFSKSKLICWQGRG